VRSIPVWLILNILFATSTAAFKGRMRKDGTKTVVLSVQRQRQKFVIADLVAKAFGEVSANA
jgi:hypothetical protein